MKVLCQVAGRYTLQLESMGDIGFANATQPMAARSWGKGEIIEVADIKEVDPWLLSSN
jgi:hypothetical protein